MRTTLNTGDLLKYRGDGILLGHFSDVRPLGRTLGQLDWMLNASLSKLWKSRPDLLGFGNMLLVATQGKLPSRAVLVMGLGPRRGFDSDLRREAYRRGLEAARKAGIGTLAVEGWGLEGKGQESDLLDDFLEGASGPLHAPEEAVLYVDDAELLVALGHKLPRGSLPGDVPEALPEAGETAP